MGRVITIPATDVVDVSAGGLFIEGLQLPLHSEVDVTFVDVDATVHARVVRVRLAGRQRGLAMPPALALLFAETEAAPLAAVLERTITPVPSPD